MKIGVIGTGNVGGTLGTRLAQGGHAVIFGTRHPESEAVLALLANAGASARAATVSVAVAESEIVIVATPWTATQAAVLAGGNWTGKILVDATNPLTPNLDGLTIGTTTSAAENVANWASGAKVVKAFNTVGANIMGEPDFGGLKPVLFYCGDDPAAKIAVHSLADELGFDPIDAGPLTQARLLEPFALLWISLAFAAGFGRDIAFQFLKR